MTIDSGMLIDIFFLNGLDNDVFSLSLFSMFDSSINGFDIIALMLLYWSTVILDPLWNGIIL